jgi:hypothetical protein
MSARVKLRYQLKPFQRKAPFSCCWIGFTCSPEFYGGRNFASLSTCVYYLAELHSSRLDFFLRYRLANPKGPEYPSSTHISVNQELVVGTPLGHAVAC